jgi:hypothetical protein
VVNSIVLKTAVLGSKAVEGERNLVAIKTKGYQDKEFEQPIFSLTLGKQDMVGGLDLTLASDHNPEVEFKLISGTGPVIFLLHAFFFIKSKLKQNSFCRSLLLVLI